MQDSYDTNHINYLVNKRGLMDIVGRHIHINLPASTTPTRLGIGYGNFAWDCFNRRRASFKIIQKQEYKLGPRIRMCELVLKLHSGQTVLMISTMKYTHRLRAALLLVQGHSKLVVVLVRSGIQPLRTVFRAQTTEERKRVMVRQHKQTDSKKSRVMSAE